MPFVSERWPGGMLTNFQTVRSRLKRLEELETMEEEGTISRYSKKMISSMRREKRKILRNLDGVRTMTELPAAILVVDPRHELIAVKESKTLSIPSVAVIDTDCNPELVDIPVPANDDAFRSVQMVLASLTEAVGEGVAAWREKMELARKLEEQKEEAARKIKEARELARRQAQAAKAEKASKPEKQELPKEPASGEGADKSAQDGVSPTPAGESTSPGSS
jgi:small subunit ribosomal protein S2